MRIALAGSGSIADAVARAISNSSHTIVMLVQNGRRTKGAKRYVRHAMAMGTSVLGLARSARIPIVYIDKMTPQELEPIAATEPDLLLVAGFGIILKAPILELPRVGAVNCHSSLLPRHRGPNPFSWAIASGDKESGVSYHVMETSIDTGPIIAQYAFPIGPEETGGDVYRKAGRVAEDTVVEVLDIIERHGLVGDPQDESVATYDPKLEGERLYLDWSRPAVELERLIRGVKPFTVAKTRHRGRTIYVVAAELRNAAAEDQAPGTVLNDQGKLVVATGQGALYLPNTYTLSPVPFIWPMPWNRPQKGERLG